MIKRPLFLLAPLIVLPAFLYAATGGVVINRLGTGGAGIAFSSAAVVEVLPGNTARFSYCLRATVSAMCVWTAPSASDTAPAASPSATVGYPIGANTDYCSGVPDSTQGAVQSRIDCYNNSGSPGTIYTREEQ
jgi:hypothetical protein